MTNRACPDGFDPTAAVLAVVASIPCGRVATNGQVAVLAGLGRAARFVGHTLARLEEDGYPCHRVVNCAGRTAPGWPAQTALLAAEGVGFKPNGCVDLARFLWDGVEKRI